jgi:hypothetical protein
MALSREEDDHMSPIQPGVGSGRWRALGWTGIVVGVLLPAALLHTVAINMGSKVADTAASTPLIKDAARAAEVGDEALQPSTVGCERVVEQPLYVGLGKWVSTVVWDCSAQGDQVRGRFVADRLVPPSHADAEYLLLEVEPAPTTFAEKYLAGPGTRVTIVQIRNDEAIQSGGS